MKQHFFTTEQPLVLQDEVDWVKKRLKDDVAGQQETTNQHSSVHKLVVASMLRWVLSPRTVAAATRTCTVATCER